MHSSLIQYLSTPDYSCSQSSDASLMPNSDLAKQTGCLVFEFHCLLSPDHMYFAYHLLQLGQLQLACAGGGEHTWEKLYCSLSLVWALTPTCNLNKSAVSGKQWKQEEGWVLVQMLSLKIKLKTSLQKLGSLQESQNEHPQPQLLLLCLEEEAHPCMELFLLFVH